jgi:hypothetical protein
MRVKMTAKISDQSLCFICSHEDIMDKLLHQMIYTIGLIVVMKGIEVLKDNDFMEMTERLKKLRDKRYDLAKERFEKVLDDVHINVDHLIMENSYEL